MSTPEREQEATHQVPVVLTGAPAIVTPDAVPLDIEVATVGSRGAAFFVDLLIFGGVFALLGIAQLFLGAGGFVPGWFAIAVLLVLAFVWQFGYPIVFETRWRGRTPGKALMGLRVVTTEGAPIGVRHAAVRAMVGWFELFGTMGIAAIATSLTSSRSQRLGDLAAGTIVVREHGHPRAPQGVTFHAPAGYEFYVAMLDVSAIEPSLQATVRETMLRRQQLAPHTAAQLAARLADHVAALVRPPPPSSADATTFLLCVAAAIQARHRPVSSPPPTPPQGTPLPPPPGGQDASAGRPGVIPASAPARAPAVPDHAAPAPQQGPAEETRTPSHAQTDAHGGGFHAPQ